MKRKVIPIIFVIISVFGIVALINVQKKSTDIRSSAEISYDNLSLHYNPTSIKSGVNVTSIVATIDNLKNAKYVQFYINNQLKLEETVRRIPNDIKLIFHTITYNQSQQLPFVGGVYATDLSEENIANFHNKNIEVGFGINYSYSQQTRIRLIGENSVKHKRIINGVTVCGVEYIYYDELVHVMVSNGKTLQQAGEEAASIIIEGNKTIESSETNANCKSITKLGIVDWKLEYIREVLVALKRKANDQSFPDRKYAHIEYIQSEDYGYPWASSTYNASIADLTELKNQYNVELHEWVIGIKEALSYVTKVDKVIVADSWGRWAVKADGSSYNASRFLNNKCYSPCIFQTNITKCCPYISNVQQELWDLKECLDKGCNRSYIQFEYKFPSTGSYNLTVKILDNQRKVIKTENVTIQVNGPKICTGNCTNKECGDDGCKDSCGTCSTDKRCINNICVQSSSCSIADIWGIAQKPDGIVNIYDISKILGSWGTNDPVTDIWTTTSGSNVPDGIVDSGDLSKVLGCWEK